MGVGAEYGLETGDVRSTSMGAPGLDVLLSPAARRVFNLDIECKKVENLNVSKIFWEHFQKYKDSGALKLLVHSKNRSEALVTLRFADFLELLRRGISLDHKRREEALAASG